MENKMTPEEQQIAIAQACGWELRWQNCGGAPLLDQKPEGHCWEVWTDPSGWGLDNNFDPIRSPDYLNDLNAMHEAEKILTDSQWDEYEQQLRIVCGGCSYYEGAGKELIHATAAQRAEAFLKTLNLWKQ